MTSKTYPEHEKLQKVKHETQSVHDFLEWVGEEYSLGLRCVDGFPPAGKTLRDLLAEWKDIDQAKLEAEKQAMLEELRMGSG